MNIRPRIIPVLTIQNGGLVKTKKFKRPVYLGDPINATKIFNEKMVDELIVLDISKDRFDSGPNFELLKEISSEAFMPLAYGGGIRSVADGIKILSIGFEKLIFNTLFFEEENIIKDLIRLVGGQSIVISLDYKIIFKKIFFYSNNAGVKHKIGLKDVFNKLNELGVGEIVFQSIDRDGTKEGYDLNTYKTIDGLINVPIIALGGCSGLFDLKKVLDLGSINACAAGHIFVFYGQRDGVLINFPSEKELEDLGIY